MKLFLIVVLGIFASFSLTVLVESIWFGSATSTIWRLHPEIPAVAVIVGGIVGIAAKRQALIAAPLSLAPWSVWLVVAVNGGRSTFARWSTTIGLVGMYFALGIGAAVLAARAVLKNGQTTSREST